MSEANYGQGDENFLIPLKELPPAALQIIYHSVTGRTENYRKSLKNNVIINSDDIDQLYEVIKQQIAVYDVISGPTVNVIISHHNDKKVRYSSWERFKTLPINIKDITSDVTFKMGVRIPASKH